LKNLERKIGFRVLTLGIAIFEWKPSYRVFPMEIANLKKQKYNNMDVLKDLWLFMKERKKFWLAPIIIVLLLLGLLIVFGGGSTLAPFIYTIF